MFASEITTQKEWMRKKLWKKNTLTTKAKNRCFICANECGWNFTVKMTNSDARTRQNMQKIKKKSDVFDAFLRSQWMFHLQIYIREMRTATFTIATGQCVRFERENMKLQRNRGKNSCIKIGKQANLLLPCELGVKLLFYLLEELPSFIEWAFSVFVISWLL